LNSVQCESILRHNMKPLPTRRLLSIAQPQMLQRFLHLPRPNNGMWYNPRKNYVPFVVPANTYIFYNQKIYRI